MIAVWDCEDSHLRLHCTSLLQVPLDTFCGCQVSLEIPRPFDKQIWIKGRESVLVVLDLELC